MKLVGSLPLAASVAVAFTLPAAAQRASDLPGSTFAIVGQGTVQDAVLTAKSGSTMIELKARPVSAVRLAQSIEPQTAALFGAKADAPFDTDRVLFGWPERPGLYCDLLRTRGLGISTACVYDRDGDGQLDEGRRYDFNSGLGDLLGLTASGKIIGIRTTASKPAPVPLPRPISFVAASVPNGATGRLALKWRKVKSGEQPAAQIWIATPDNYTGTGGMSAQVAQFPIASVPIEGELYGVRLRVLGFDEKGAMRYQVLSVKDGAYVPLMFQGYTFKYILL